MKTVKDAMIIFGQWGFEYQDTGGGHDAFARRLDDGKAYVMVTDTDGHAPERDGQNLLIGFYADDDDDGEYGEATSFEDALATANRLIADHYTGG